jgi:hypothetical protein
VKGYASRIATFNLIAVLALLLATIENHNTEVLLVYDKKP